MWAFSLELHTAVGCTDTDILKHSSNTLTSRDLSTNRTIISLPCGVCEGQRRYEEQCPCTPPKLLFQLWRWQSKLWSSHAISIVTERQGWRFRIEHALFLLLCNLLPQEFFCAVSKQNLAFPLNHLEIEIAEQSCTARQDWINKGKLCVRMLSHHKCKRHKCICWRDFGINTALTE